MTRPEIELQCPRPLANTLRIRPMAWFGIKYLSLNTLNAPFTCSLSIYLSIYLCIFISIRLSIYLLYLVRFFHQDINQSTIHFDFPLNKYKIDLHRCLPIFHSISLRQSPPPNTPAKKIKEHIPVFICRNHFFLLH